MEKLLKKYDRSPLKSNIHCLQALKISLDDLLVNFLKNMCNIKQNNNFVDLRILVGCISILSAIYVTYCSVYSEFKDYKNTSCTILFIYFVINSFVMLMQKFYGNECIFQACDNSVKVYTSMSPPDTNYIVMVYRNGIIPEKYNKNVCDLFDENGNCQHKVFFDDLKKFFIDDVKKNK